MTTGAGKAARAFTRAAPRLKVVFGEKVVGQPERGAVDQHDFDRAGGGKGGSKVQRGLDRLPVTAPVALVLGDAVAHLVVPGLRGGDVAAGAGGGGDQAFGKGGFAGPGPADDKCKARSDPVHEVSVSVENAKHRSADPRSSCTRGYNDQQS